MVHQRTPLRLLAVDYLGLIASDNKHAERRYQIGDICSGLREIGQQLQIPVIALCQLNRAADEQRPRMNNLSDSGDIEKHADIVAMLYKATNETKEKVTELIIEKCRHGPGGIMPLHHDGVKSIFSDPNAPQQWGY